MKQRLASLDAFRGLTIAGMILVNNPGDWSRIYRPLLHAEWHGWTPTDWIFPFFLFIMGVAMALSFRRRVEGGAAKAALWAKVLRRTAILFGLGLILSGWPRFDLAGIRIMGVLQRISICYLIVCATILILPRQRHQWLVMAALIAVYLAVMYGLNVPGYGRGVLTPEGHAGGYIDRLILGQRHLWRGGSFDPEGLVTTLPAILTAFLGLQFGRVLLARESHHDRLRHWLIWSGVLIAAGLIANLLIPINKQLWTPSYALFMAGLGGLFLAACYWLMDVRGWRRWFAPFVMLGMNPLIIFWLSGVLVRSMILIKVGGGDGQTSLWRWLYLEGLAFWLPDYPASLAFALANVAFWLLVAWGLYRRRWFVRV